MTSKHPWEPWRKQGGRSQQDKRKGKNHKV